MNGKNNNMPKLRFPEFRDAGEWNTESLGYQTKKVGSGITPKGGDKNYKSEGRPFVRSQNIGWGQLILEEVAYIDEATHSTFSATEIKDGDVLLNITGASIGRCSVADFRIRGGNVNQHVCIIRSKVEKLNPFFLNQFILSNSGQRQIDSFQAGGNREGLNFAQIRSFSIPIPPVTKEQQKIAGCLSSIDALITAHSQKHTALKTHKKGLMQQLFPAEGKTLPKLRFPEFRAAGEWNEDIFDELVDVIDGDRGKNYPKSGEFSGSGYCVFLNAKNVTKNGFKFKEVQFIAKEKDGALRKGKLQREDVVLTTRGSVGQFAYYARGIPYDNMRINSGMVVLRIKNNKVNSDYLYNFCKSELLAAYIDNIAFGNAQQQLTVAEIKKFRLQFPEPQEQKKIADCLSSIDDLITAQAQKIESLKAHKKGLMQQLFPAANEEHG